MLRKLMLLVLVTVGAAAGCRAHAGGHVGSVGAHAGVAAGHR